jgi:hypothetical protein
MKRIILSLAVISLIGLSGCGRASKQDISKKTSSIKTKSELESVMGKPDDFNKVGPIETWKYKASDGEVVFVIMGDKVTLQAAGNEKEK